MEEKKIVIDELVTNHIAVTPDEGKPIFDSLFESLEKKEKVVLDFTGMEIITTAFLNVAIGDLYKTYSSEQLKELLVLSGLDEAGKRRIKKVTDRAKLFYQNPEDFSQSVNRVLDGSI